MILKEIMTPSPEAVDANDSLQKTAERMQSLDVGIFPVRDENEIVGVVTDRDMVVRGMADQLDPQTTQVKQIMTDQALSMHLDTDLHEAVTSMEQQQVRRLLVVDDQKNVVGIVSLGDIAVRSSEDLAGEALEKVSDPTQPDRVGP